MMFGETVEVLTYPTVRDRGRDVPDYSATPTAVALRGVDVQPGLSTELVAQRAEGVSVRWTVFVPVSSIPAGVVLSADSLIRVRGQVHQVDGEPGGWIDGGPLDHFVLLLVRWEQT